MKQNFLRFPIVAILCLCAPVLLRANDDSVAPAKTAVSRLAAINIDAARTAAKQEVSAQSVAQRAVPARTSISRAAINTSRNAISTGEMAEENLNKVSSQSGRDAAKESASVNSSAPVRRAGVSLRPSTAEVGGRATIAGTSTQTGTNIEQAKSTVAPRQARAGTTVGIRNAPKQATVEDLETIEKISTLTKSCTEQYTDCLDQFCAVLDANQKRCSCSEALSAYTNDESTIKKANEQLNEAAQQIRYIGLSADEIRAIMSATEAEQAMQGVSDTSESRKMLEKIEKMIQSPTAYSSNDGYSADLFEVDFNSDNPADIFNLDFGSTKTLANMRGKDLYNAAKSRCSAILNSCKASGANTQSMTAAYDLAIDRDCVAYGAGLNKMKATVRTNVRSAQNMVVKARLTVLENKNQFDGKGCIGQLEACMKDDMVCGDDYFKCLDPTKKFIDESGNVVLGRDITEIRKTMSEYNNASIGDQDYYGSLPTTYNDCPENGKCIVRYLLSKIGTGDARTSGLCRPVLDKCQDYTYYNGHYMPFNTIVQSYIQRAMVQIKSAQETIISDYASSCMGQVATCYNQQVSQVDAWSASANTASVYSIMRGACRNVALTCGYAVFAAPASAGNPNLCRPDASTVNDDECINQISELFYQSLLCPENSYYQKETPDGTQGGDQYNGRFFANEKCLCAKSYGFSGGRCQLCPTGSKFSGNSNDVASGVMGCVCDDSLGYELNGGYCRLKAN